MAENLATAPISRRIFMQYGAGFAAAALASRPLRAAETEMHAAPKGILVAAGGGLVEFEGTVEQLREKITPLSAEEADPTGILRKVVELTGKPSPKVVCITGASKMFRKETAEQCKLIFPKFGVTDLTCFDDDPEGMREKSAKIAAAIREADVVWFTGGDQERISAGMVGTVAQAALLERYRDTKNFVVGGTSAGAAVLSKRMIANYGNPPKRAEGLGLAPHITFETHLLKRTRRPSRLLEALEDDCRLAQEHPEEHPARIGIGMDEGTAVIIKDGKISVAGLGRAVVAYKEHMRGELGLDTVTDMDLKQIAGCERFADQGLILCTYGKQDEFPLGRFAPIHKVSVQNASLIVAP